MQSVIQELYEGYEYIAGAFTKVKPMLSLALSVIWSGISYILFPNESYLTAACAVGGVMILDVITKYYALKKPYGSVYEAIKAGAIKSDSFFQGTKKKLISFLTLMILCGLSVRVVPIGGIAVFAGSIVYSVMFLRECQSCIENLIAGGNNDLEWLLPLLRKKERNLLSLDEKKTKK